MFIVVHYNYKIMYIFTAVLSYTGPRVCFDTPYSYSIALQY